MSVYSSGRYINMISDTDYSAVNSSSTPNPGTPTYLFSIVSFASSSANPTNRTIVLTTSATDANVLGVLNNSPKAGEVASVCGRNAMGTFKVRVSANSSGVAVGDWLTASADSGAITTTTSTNYCIGRALEAGVAGQVIEYLPVNTKYND